MAAIDEVGRSLLGRIGGRHSTSLASAGLKVEVGEMRKLAREVDVVRESVIKLRQEMDSLAKSSARVGGTKIGKPGKSNGQPSFSDNFTSQPIAPSGSTQGGATGGGGGVAGALGSKFMGIAAVGGFMGGQLMGALDNRISRGAEYAANADRLNVILQQTSGLSQNQVMNQMRKPIANYRLGPNGINDLMAFQNQTGYNATPQMANSLAGIRALSGYTKTTADVLADQRAAMDPTTANRMLWMTGTNAYTYGGGLNDPMKMRQQITQNMGLTNASVLKGAKGPGSVTRARLTDAGVPVELQDEILTYAQSNLTYQAKGGKGMYDPSKKSHRRLMGIEENFATQQEETDRLRQSREEDFSRRQLDNFAAQERTTQTLIKALGSLEDKLSALVGARTSAGNWMKIGGRLMQAAGGIMMAVPGLGTAAGAGLLAGGTALAGSGDPVDAGGGGGAGSIQKTSSGNDSNIAVPVGYNGKRASLTEVKQRPDFRKLNPKMQDRLLNMFRTNPNVGIGGGFRDTSAQEAMFRSRYRPTSKKTDTYWQGQYWEHVSGAAAAPPGRSMHEIGLAADLVGDLKWMNANASKFGLRHFASVNSEPWHVQPAELAGSRREYEKQGASWGTDGGFAADNSGPVTGETSGAHGEDGGGNVGGMGMRSFAGMSISSILEAMAADKSGGYRDNSAVVKKAGNATIGNTPIAGVSTAGGSGAIAGVDVARAAYAAGFRKDDLVKMIAIAKRESGWRPRAYNGNLATGDQSYGLWQLNTLNSKKGGNMGDLVNSILGHPKGNKNFDELFDPSTNARVAYEFYRRNGNTLRPWGGYKGVSDTHNADQHMAAAQQAVQEAHLSGDPYSGGDAAPAQGRSVTTNLSHAPTYQITVAPQITFVGTPASPDLKKIAQEVTSLIHEQTRTLEMRGA